MKIIKPLLVVIAFLASGSVVAENICEEHLDEWACNDEYECTWSDYQCVDSKGSDVQGDLNMCLVADGIDDCSSLPECEWSDGICMNANQSS